MQSLTETEEAIMNHLIATKRLYRVPAKCLDDYYWMMASVIDQQTRRTSLLLGDDGQQLQQSQRQEQESRLMQQPPVYADNAQGQFPGLRPMLISNDLMRDHWLALLEPRLFRRWRSCHIVNYDIKPYVDNEWEERKVEFVPADFFSREIQGNLMPTAIDGVAASEDRGNESMSNNQLPWVWHFPVTGWDEPDRLCICIDPPTSYQ
jgi:nitrate reductase cytochrome c-type subunit